MDAITTWVFWVIPVKVHAAWGRPDVIYDKKVLPLHVDITLWGYPNNYLDHSGNFEFEIKNQEWEEIELKYLNREYQSPLTQYGAKFLSYVEVYDGNFIVRGCSCVDCDRFVS